MHDKKQIRSHVKLVPYLCRTCALRSQKRLGKLLCTFQNIHVDLVPLDVELVPLKKTIRKLLTQV